MTSPHLIFGCGYLGRRVAKAWLEMGRRVAALTRSHSEQLTSLGVQPIVGDVLDPASLKRLPEADTVLYSVGFDRASGKSMREVYVDGLRIVLRATRCSGPFLFVSSTSVYGQTNGDWVDETSPVEPIEESGKIVLEAERTLREYRPDAIVLRLAGIYGPGRIPRQRALMHDEPLVGDAEKWLNLVHVDDGVQAVLAVETRGNPGETYLVADGEPVRRRDFYSVAAELIGAPPARFQSPSQPIREANRRVVIEKARNELKFSPRHPNYHVGLAASSPRPVPPLV